MIPRVSLAIIFLALLFSEAFAYEIIAIDDAMYSFQDSVLTKDSHRYKTTYEIDEHNRTVTEVETTDLNGGGVHRSGTVYKIISPPTQE